MARIRNETARPGQPRWYGKANRLSGFVIMGTMLATGLIIAVGERPEGDKGFNAYDLVLPGFGYAGIIIFSRAEIVASPFFLLIKGPFIQRRIPWSRIEDIDSKGKWLTITADGESYTATAVEAMNYSLMFNRRSAPQDIHKQILEYRESRATFLDGPVRWSFVRPPMYELALLPVWVAILLDIWTS
ncbi:hypothetical protein UG55_1008192 [Frankia sp. EI5c]|uniref:hypothetical protein n=1 Tax=Frankia sp. EI5c TaxID=683316 RepID=UPI0007C2166A|nr:hypothetical protein [Frankia sp. EI5c]OAA27541.1 hypothetical protein UG55_1008192 [Frankia sp. EI5c]